MRLIAMSILVLAGSLLVAANIDVGVLLVSALVCFLLEMFDLMKHVQKKVHSLLGINSEEVEVKPKPIPDSEIEGNEPASTN